MQLNAMFNYEIIEPINKYEKQSLVSFIYSQQHGHNSLYRVLNEIGNKDVNCNASDKYCLFITKIIEDVIILSQRIHFSFKLFEYFLSLYFAKTHLYYLGQFTFEPLFWEELEKQISETNDSGKTWLPLQNGLFDKKASLFNELANTYYKILSTKGPYFIESIGIKKIHLSN
jgi:hypothetical protein